jgi:ribosomal protein S18 acetylase RimI-like enzyme
VAGAIREDVWLAGVLGRPVFAVEGDAELPPATRPVFYYAKVPVEQVALAARLCARGFSPVDVSVTLTRAGATAPTAPGGVSVGPARPEDHQALLDVAGRCFRYSRFHLDPAIPDELAHRVKREWVRSYVEGKRGIELLAAREGGRPVGFLAVLADERARVIDLVGVAPEAQGRGVGAALVAAFVDRHGAEAEELRVGTQAANLPSLRLYEKLGFTVAVAAYVLHLHAGA